MTKIDRERVRTLKDVVREMPESEFLGWVAEGLDLVLKHAEELHRAQVLLVECDQHGAARILHSICEEEAAKFLILLDAVRCPRKPESRAEQARRFEDHIAKGIYARSCGMKPGTLGELQAYINLYRECWYLDGPDRDNWYFKNDVLRQRESAMYVDYVSIDESNYWLDPARDAELLPVGRTEPPALSLSRALAAVGVRTIRGLEVVARVWQPIDVAPHTTWDVVRRLNKTTLDALGSLGMLASASDHACQQVLEEWQFPMYAIDLHAISN